MSNSPRILTNKDFESFELANEISENNMMVLNNRRYRYWLVNTDKELGASRNETTLSHNNTLKSLIKARDNLESLLRSNIYNLEAREIFEPINDFIEKINEHTSDERDVVPLMLLRVFSPPKDYHQQAINQLNKIIEVMNQCQEYLPRLPNKPSGPRQFYYTDELFGCIQILYQDAGGSPTLSYGKHDTYGKTYRKTEYLQFIKTCFLDMPIGITPSDAALASQAKGIKALIKKQSKQ